MKPGQRVKLRRTGAIGTIIDKKEIKEESFNHENSIEVDCIKVEMDAGYTTGYETIKKFEEVE